MFKVSHTTLIVLSGLIWFAVGCFLLCLGINFLVGSLLHENLHTLSRPILDRLSPLSGGLEQAALIVVAISLAIGIFKGRFVFNKTVQKSVNRILSLPNPAPLNQIYTKKYYILLGCMFLIGFLVRFAPLDIRGAIDIAVGCALINGSVLYFRQAYRVYSTS